jgi:hypothetical protein
MRALLPARTDTKWFREYILGKAEIRFIKGRLKFGDSEHSAHFPSMTCVWKGSYTRGDGIILSEFNQEPAARFSAATPARSNANRTYSRATLF